MASVKLTEEQRVALRNRREELAIGQEDVEGIAGRTVRRIESGEVDRFRAQTLAELAVGLHMSPDDLDMLGLHAVALRARLMIQRRDEYAAEVLRTMERRGTK